MLDACTSVRIKRIVLFVLSFFAFYSPACPASHPVATRPRQVMFAKRAPEKMKLSCGGQSCRNGLAYVGSGDRPVLSVFHEIRCHQTNIGTFIRKDSDHAGTSPNFTVQSLDHVGRRDFSSAQHGECIEGQRIFPPSSRH